MNAMLATPASLPAACIAQLVPSRWQSGQHRVHSVIVASILQSRQQHQMSVQSALAVHTQQTTNHDAFCVAPMLGLSLAVTTSKTACAMLALLGATVQRVLPASIVRFSAQTRIRQIASCATLERIQPESALNRRAAVRDALRARILLRQEQLHQQHAQCAQVAPLQQAPRASLIVASYARPVRLELTPSVRSAPLASSSRFPCAKTARATTVRSFRPASVGHLCVLASLGFRDPTVGHAQPVLLERTQMQSGLGSVQRVHPANMHALHQLRFAASALWAHFWGQLVPTTGANNWCQLLGCLQLVSLCTYSNLTGVSVCQKCGAGAYSALAGATTDKFCVCNAGWTLANTSCETCEIGKYKNFSGSAECSLCSSGSSSPSGSDSHEDCRCSVQTGI